MSDTSPGFMRQLPSALPGLALIIGTMVVIRLWIEPWMTSVMANALGFNGLHPSHLGERHE